MANVVTLSDSVASIDLATGGGTAGLGARSIRVGRVEAGRQIVTLLGAQITGSSVDDALARYTELERMLHDAADYRALGMGRRVTLSITPDGASSPVSYHVRGGRVPELAAAPSYLLSHRNYLGPFDAEIEVEPFGRGPEVVAVNAAGTLRNRGHLTHRYLATGATGTGVDGTASGSNTISLVDGSLFRTSRLTTTPTDVTPAANHAIYVGSTIGTFDRLILGLSVAAAGITWTGWEYWNGAAWTAFTPTTNDFLTGSNQLGVASRMGQVVFPALSGWASKAFNGVTAFWARLRVTSVSTPTAPVLLNGPVRNLSNAVAIAGSAVGGDVPALGLVHLKNDGATALAGVRAALHTGRLATVPPPISLGLLSASSFVPTSGDNTVAAGTDAEATNGERVEASLAPTFTDSAQTWDGSSENATVAVASGDKIDGMGGGSFFIEVAFMLDTDSTRPQPFISRWTTTSGNRSWWFGVDDLRLRGMVSTDGDNRRVVNGNRRLKRRHRYMGTMEFDSTARKVRLYLDGKLEAEANVKSNVIRRTITTAMNVAFSVGFTSSESRNGQDSEDHLDGITDWIMLYGDRVEDFVEDVLEPAGHSKYNYPNDSNDVARSDSANVRALYEMNDNAATTTIVDSAVTFAAAKNLTRVGNTSTNRRPGVRQGGIGTFTRLLGGNLPQCLAEEYAGTYRILLAAKQAATLSDLDEVAFQLQLNVGDSKLQLGPPVYFPVVGAPSSGYHILDLGNFTIPPAALYDGHRGSGSAANFVQWSLFVKHKFTSLKVMHLDNLYLLPTADWYGQHDAFDDDYDAAYGIAQNEGIAFDSRGPIPLAYQTTTGGLTVADRNPYAVPASARPRFQPNKPAWLFGLSFRGDTTSGYLYRVISDTATPSVKVVSRFRGLAS